jgi:lipid II:glycine glycyltransferase (peptidoglycan interpeptide bridge formation enzyme)
MGINVLRVVPNLRDDNTGRKVTEFLESAGFKRVRNVPCYHTLMVFLKEPEQDIRHRIHRDCRRILRKAERMEIEVREGTTDEFFNTLEHLYFGAKKRKGFKGLDSQEFAKTQQMLAPKDKATVLIAHYNGHPVTAHATTHFGNTAVPILTASNETGLRCGTSYLLWWKAYLVAKNLGMEYYDLGAVDPNKDPKGYLFKKRMGGEETFHIGAFDVCTNLRVKATWRMAEKIFHVLKR